MLQAKIDQIIYNPVGWIHPQRRKFAAAVNTVRCRSIINDILIKQYALPLNGINTTNNLEVLFIQFWSLLPQAALRIACLRWRSMLAVSGNIMRIDPQVRQFALLDIIPASACNDRVFSEESLWNQAVKELLAYKHHLSAALVQRLPLLFSESVTDDLQSAETANPDPLLLRLAIQHAK